MKKLLFCAVAMILIITACKKPIKSPTVPTVPQNTATSTPTQTSVNTVTITPTITVTFTNSATDTTTLTSTITSTNTITPTVTATATCTVTPLTMTFQKGVLPDASYTGCDGTFIANYFPDKTYGACTYLVAKKEMSLVDNAFIRFSVSSIPAGSTIARAYLTMGSNVYYDISHNTPYTINIYRCATNWASGDLCDVTVDASVNTHTTWTRSGITDWVSAGGDKAELAGAFIYSGNGYHTSEISAAAVQSWVDSPSTNYGLMLEAASGNDSGLVFYSDNHSTATVRPKLTVYYYAP